MTRFFCKLNLDPVYHAVITNSDNQEWIANLNFSLNDDSKPYNKVFNRINGGETEAPTEKYEFKKVETARFTYAFIKNNEELGYIVDTQNGNSVIETGDGSLLVEGKVGFWFKGLTYRLRDEQENVLIKAKFKTFKFGFEMESDVSEADLEFFNDLLVAFVFATSISYPILMLNDMNNWT